MGFIGWRICVNNNKHCNGELKNSEDYATVIAGVFSSEPVQENNYTAENILLITGTVSMLASIPFFIASKKIKEERWT